jgi:signal transduction histidine kinase
MTRDVIRTSLRYGRPAPGGRRIRPMSGDLDQAGFAEPGLAEYLTPRTTWAIVAAFAAVTAVAALPVKPNAPTAVIAGLVTVGAAGLLVQRRRPQLLYAAVATAGIAVLADGRSSNVGWFVVCLIAGWCVLIDSRIEGLVYWAAAMILFAVEWLAVRPDPGWAAWLAGVTLTVLFSLLIRHERDLLRQLRRAQAGLAEQARTQERNRIARELHDVIGHTLTVSLLHVQSARLAVEHDPADAARALAEAERLGRECLAEVRTTVGMLRQDDPAVGNAPLPGADGLPALVEQFRSAGAAVTFTVEGDTGGLPATTGLALYRIAQEALTNAVKHAPGSPTEVRLVVAPGAVTLTADSQAVPGSGTGLGVVSMRERAESVGGTCEAGPGGRGWLVRAVLPLTVPPGTVLPGTAHPDTGAAS